MSHAHHHATADYGRVFKIAIGLNLAYVIAEATFGTLSGSLALLADAGHNFSDVLGLLLAWGGYALARVPPNDRRTYGWRGSTILAALLNALLLLVAVGGIAWEAVRRFVEPRPVHGASLVAVAAAGVAVNAAAALLFMAGRDRDLNLRGAFLHMTADAGVSVGVVLAGILVGVTGLAWIDPAVSLLIAAAVFWSTWGLLKDSANLALQAVPPGVDFPAVRDYLAGLPGVIEVHDLHVWAMSTTETALTAHLVKPGPTDDDQFLFDAAAGLHARFDIDHATIQLERGTAPGRCPQGLPDAL